VRVWSKGLRVQGRAVVKLSFLKIVLQPSLLFLESKINHFFKLYLELCEIYMRMMLHVLASLCQVALHNAALSQILSVHKS
jgi:hypothetical protein